jgi:small-conductance mechanosensitive channel
VHARALNKEMHVNSIERFIKEFGRWFSQPLFHVGDVEIGLSRITIALLIVAVTWVLSSRFERAVRRLAAQGKVTRMSGSAAYALGRVIRYVGIVMGVLIGLRILGVELTSLAIFGGAIGVGIGIGLQNIFNNFLSGIVLLFEKTLKVGDFVELEFGLVGRVAEIDMRYTRITTNDLVDVIVPNSQFTENRVTNWSYGEQTRRVHVPFGVAYTARKDEVREAGIEAARQVEGTELVEGRTPDVWLVGFGDSGLNFELVVWVSEKLLTTPARATALYFWAIHDALAKRNIEIPYPQRDLHLRSGRLEVDLRPDGAGPQRWTLSQA